MVMDEQYFDKKYKFSSFIFSKHYIQVRGVVDLMFILGKLGMMWEYTLYTGMYRSILGYQKLMDGFMDNQHLNLTFSFFFFFFFALGKKHYTISNLNISFHFPL